MWVVEAPSISSEILSSERCLRGGCENNGGGDPTTRIHRKSHPHPRIFGVAYENDITLYLKFDSCSWLSNNTGSLSTLGKNFPQTPSQEDTLREGNVDFVRRKINRFITFVDLTFYDLIFKKHNGYHIMKHKHPLFINCTKTCQDLQNHRRDFPHEISFNLKKDWKHFSYWMRLCDWPLHKISHPHPRIFGAECDCVVGPPPAPTPNYDILITKLQT